MFDIRNTMIETVYPFRKVCRDAKEFEAVRDEVLSTKLPGEYGKLEKTLELLPGPFVGGATPAPSDFHLFGQLR